MQKTKFQPYVKVIKDFGDMPEIKELRRKHGPNGYALYFSIMMYLSNKFNYISSYSQLQDIADDINGGYKGPDAVTPAQVFEIVSDESLFYHEGTRFQCIYLVAVLPASVILGQGSTDSSLRNIDKTNRGKERENEEISCGNEHENPTSFENFSRNNNINNNINNYI